MMQKLILVSFIVIGSLVQAAPQFVELQNYPFKGIFRSTMSADIFFFEREDFDRAAVSRSVKVLPGHKELPYNLWLQKKPAPLVFIVSGFDDNSRGNETLALAMVLFKKGFSVAATASTFHFEFMHSALSHSLPGYTPEDTKDIQRSFRLILEDIRKKYSEKINSVGVIGYSLGALQVLFLASLEKNSPEPERIGAKAFIAVCPPYDSIYSLRYVDESYNKYKIRAKDLKEDKDKKRKTAFDTIERLENLDLARNPEQQTEFIRSMDEDSLELGIAISFRFDLWMVLGLAVSEHRIDSLVKNGPLKDLDVPNFKFFRQKLYKSIEKNYNWDRYIKDALVPSYLEIHPDWDLKTMIEKSGLKSIAEDLKTDDRITVFHNVDDSYMLTPEYKIEFENIFDDRLTYFDKGGHVGNLYMPQVQDAIAAALEKRLGN